MSDFDLFIIGAGPAGLMAAVSAAAAGKRVGVAEFLPSAGRKLLASGSGKCNLTNLLTPEEMAASFLMEHDDLVIVDADKNVIFSSLNEDKQADFFEKMHQGGKKYEMMDLNG